MAEGRSLRRDFDMLSRVAGGKAFFVLAAVSAVFVLGLFNMRADRILTIPATIERAGEEDLLAFWRGSELALRGEAADAYDREVFRSGLPETGAGLLFLNPPHFFLMLAPLALLPYGAAKALWIALNLAAMAGIALLAAKNKLQAGLFVGLALLSPAAFGSFFFWQVAPFVAAGLAAALLHSRTRPLLAGALLALLTVKPQYGLMAPILLVAFGDWKAVASAAAFTVAMVVASVAVFGVEPWLAFFTSLSENHAPHAAHVVRDMVSIHQTAAKLGLDGAERWAVHGLGVIALALAVYVAGKRWSREAAVGFALLASAAASPSFWVYDWPIVAAGLFLLARACGPWPFSLQIAAFCAWIGPLLPMGIDTMASSAAATCLLIIALTLFYAHLEKLRQRGTASAEGFGAPHLSALQA